MLIFVVLLVFVNILMVKTENDVIKVIIKQGTAGSCTIRPIDLTDGTKFTLEVTSHYFINEGMWEKDNAPIMSRLEYMENSTTVVNYNKVKHSPSSSNRTDTVTLNYIYSHTRVVDGSLKGSWNFTFQYLKVYNPWMMDYKNVGTCTCSASIKVRESKTGTRLYGNNDKPRAQGPLGGGGGDPVDPRWTWFIAVLGLFGLLVLVQSSYIIYGKVKSRRANRNNDKDPISPKSPKGKRSKAKTSIADRPPLPLPPDEVIQSPPQPPLSPKAVHRHHTPPSRPPLSPGPVHKHLFPTAPPMPVEIPFKSHPVPLITKPSYRVMENCDEGVRSPVFDRRHQGPSPLVPKHSYRNKALVASVEELRTPGCSRRYMDGPLPPKQSYRNKALVASVEELRTPGCHRRYMDGPTASKQSYNNTISDDSDEEHRVPGFARRQIEAKFAQIPPKALAPSKSFKLPKPLPRAPPSPTLERVPAFNPAHRSDPVPPLHPKKMPVFPPPAPFRKQDPSRMSDDEWQYEQLQPASKYLNNFSNSNNYIK